jgi:hypothetical protein
MSPLLLRISYHTYVGRYVRMYVRTTTQLGTYVFTCVHLLRYVCTCIRQVADTTSSTGTTLKYNV